MFSLFILLVVQILSCCPAVVLWRQQLPQLLPRLVESETDELPQARSGLQNPLGPATLLEKSQSAGGVVCPSFLEPSIQHDQLLRYLNQSQVSPEGFVNETERLCTAAGFPKVGERPSYQGSWMTMGAPAQADVELLQGLANWVAKEKAKNLSDSNMTWHKFSKPDDGASAGNLVLRVATHPTNLSISAAPRLLDFGCGSGQDLAAAKRAFGAAKEDALCLDIFEVQSSEVTTVKLDASSEATYKASLDATLAENQDSVHVVFSMVTFHHITGQMRPDALHFIKNVLAPGGIFLMAEWDNSPTAGVPSREVYFDLVHFLPGVLFSNNPPQDPAPLKLSTKYLTVAERRSESQATGLQYNAERSKVVGNVTPEELANSSLGMNRDYYIVFSRPA